MENEVKGKQSMLASIANEVREAETKIVRAEVKQLFTERKKAVEVLNSIDQKIVDTLVANGEDESSVRALLLV